LGHSYMLREIQLDTLSLDNTDDLTVPKQASIRPVSITCNSCPKASIEGQPITVWSIRSLKPNTARTSAVICPRTPIILDISKTASTSAFTSSSKGNPSFNLGSNGALNPTPTTTTGIFNLFINFV